MQILSLVTGHLSSRNSKKRRHQQCKIVVLTKNLETRNPGNPMDSGFFHGFQICLSLRQNSELAQKRVFRAN